MYIHRRNSILRPYVSFDSPVPISINAVFVVRHFRVLVNAACVHSCMQARIRERHRGRRASGASERIARAIASQAESEYIVWIYLQYQYTPTAVRYSLCRTARKKNDRGFGIEAVCNSAIGSTVNIQMSGRALEDWYLVARICITGTVPVLFDTYLRFFFPFRIILLEYPPFGAK